LRFQPSAKAEVKPYLGTAVVITARVSSLLHISRAVTGEYRALMECPQEHNEMLDTNILLTALG
jgi:hypothetical protein